MTRFLVGLGISVLVACTTSAPPAPAPAAAPASAPSTSSASTRASSAPAPATVATEPRPAGLPEGINDRWVQITPDDAAKTLERDGREVFAAREAVLAALELKPGEAVADIGAGTGFFVRMFAESVGPTGRVYGVDIAPALVEGMAAWARSAGATQVTAVLGGHDDARLPEDSVDVVFTSDTYHHFEAPAAVLASLQRALRPGGRLFVLDFERIEGVSDAWLLKHVRAGKPTVIAEIEAAGFAFRGEIEVAGLEDNYLIEFAAP